MIEAPQIVSTSDGGQPLDSHSPKQGDSSVAAAPLRQPATRVYVDQDGSGVFIYRLVDVVTGRVLVELPRERAEELKNAQGYEAGALVSTSA